MAKCSDCKIIYNDECSDWVELCPRHAAVDALEAALIQVRDSTEIQIKGGIVDAALEVVLKSLCDHFGYGNVMASASRLWRDIDDEGAFLFGPCVAVAKGDAKAIDAALAAAKGGKADA